MREDSFLGVPGKVVKKACFTNGLHFALVLDHHMYLPDPPLSVFNIDSKRQGHAVSSTFPKSIYLK